MQLDLEQLLMYVNGFVTARLIIYLVVPEHSVSLIKVVFWRYLASLSESQRASF